MPLYTALAENEIRLLIIHPGAFNDALRISLETASLFSPTLEPYQALSYAWGDVSRVECIDCDGVPTDIITNLAHALRCIRSESEPCTLWADAVCINQADLEERNHQVSLMRHIYVKAHDVIIWVGEADDSTEAVMLWFQEFDKHFEDETQRAELEYMIQEDKYQQKLAKVRAFVSRPWFHRAWTFQEACLASSAHVQCGRFTLPWLTLCSASILARDVSINQKAFGDATGHVGSLAYYSVMTQVGGEDFRFGTLLRQTRSRIATDPRDKIYSLLGLLPAIEVKPDYQLSVQQIYCTSVKGIIARDQSLDILSDSNGARNDNGLPSWVPDWRESLQTSPLCRESNDQGVDGGVGPPFAVNSSSEKPIMLQQGTEFFRLEVQGNHFVRIASVWSLEGLANDLRNHRQDWRKVVRLLSDFLEQTGLPKKYPHTNESSTIALLRTLSADTFPVSDRVGIALRQKKFPWHHDWLRQEIDIDHKTFHRQKLVKHFGIDSVQTRAKYRSKAFDMSKRIQHVYEGLFCEISGRQPAITSGWVEKLSKLLGDSRPAQLYFSYESTKSRIAVEMVDGILEWIGGRSFVVTEHGLMGMGPAHVARGDSVYLLCGAKVPFVLRSDGTELTPCKLVGESYLHGIMYGEALRRKRNSILPRASIQPEHIVII